MRLDLLMGLLLFVVISVSGILASEDATGRAEEIRLEGIAIEPFETADAIGWVVSVDRVLIGPSKLEDKKSRAFRHLSAVYPEVVDPEIEPGDLVEVFGFYRDDGDFLLMYSAGHHIRRVEPIERNQMSGLILGSVFDGDTGDPAEGAELDLYLVANNSLIATESSYLDGDFCFEGKTEPDAKYLLICTALGYETWKNCFVTEGHGNAQIIIELNPEDAEVTKPVVVTGCISNADTREIVEGADVRLFLKSGGSCALKACSDSCGEFYFGEGVEPGIEYDLNCEAQCYKTWDEDFVAEVGGEIWFDVELEPL